MLTSAVKCYELKVSGTGVSKKGSGRSVTSVIGELAIVTFIRCKKIVTKYKLCFYVKKQVNHGPVTI